MADVQQQIGPLREERQGLALLTAENDAEAVQESARLAAEIETLEGRRSTLRDALEQAAGSAGSTAGARRGDG